MSRAVEAGPQRIRLDFLTAFGPEGSTTCSVLLVVAIARRSVTDHAFKMEGQNNRDQTLFTLKVVKSRMIGQGDGGVKSASPRGVAPCKAASVRGKLASLCPAQM